MKIRSPNAAIAALDFVIRPIKLADARMLEPAKVGWGRKGPIYQDKRGRIHGAYTKPQTFYGVSGIMHGEPYPLMNGPTDASPQRVTYYSLEALVAIGVITEADADEHNEYVDGNSRAHRSCSDINAVRRLAEASGIGGATLMKTLDRLEKHACTPESETAK